MIYAFMIFDIAGTALKALAGADGSGSTSGGPARGWAVASNCGPQFSPGCRKGAWPMNTELVVIALMIVQIIIMVCKS